MNVLLQRRAAILIVGLSLTLTARQISALDALLLQDTYVDSGTDRGGPPKSSNYGAGTDLRVFKGNGRLGRTFLKFSLGTLPANVTAGQIVQARLRLWVNSNTTAVGCITLKPVTSAWDEYKLTESPAPSMNSDFFKVADLEIEAINSFVSIDLTAWIKAWLDGTLRNEGILIEPASTTDFLDLFFDSKESDRTSHEARLEITLAID